MSYQSEFYPGEKIYDDGNFSSLCDVDPNVHGRGRYNRVEGYGETDGVGTSDMPLIPREEWDERIEEMERTKSRISDLCIAANLPCKDQNGTNYCWINAPTHAIEVLRVIQNQNLILLSPASVGAKIKNFKNQGGWGLEGLKYIAKYGVVPVNLWPANAINRKYDTAEAWAAAEDYKAVEWDELKPRNLDELFTRLFNRIPVPVGYDWWGHEVLACDPAKDKGEYVLRIRNSWAMSWGFKGFNILKGRKMFPDDAVAPRAVTPS